MKQADVLVVGQGISGILLSRRLMRAGKTVFVIDDEDPLAASRHAAAILNPVNLGKMHSAWSYTEMEVAQESYRDLSSCLNMEVFSELDLYTFLDSSVQVPLELQDIVKPVNENVGKRLNVFFHTPDNARNYAIKVWKIQYQLLQKQWRTYLDHKQCRLNGVFDYANLRVKTSGFGYENLRFRQIVFCEGLRVLENPFYPMVRFTKNRGNYLLLHIPDLPENAVYQYGERLVPWQPEVFWYGSNYQWIYSDLVPDQQWRSRALRKLERWLKMPFRVLEHQMAERPTTPGQRPLINSHPEHRGMYIFNGMGTKGFTLGPHSSRQLAARMLRDLSD